MIKLCLFHVYTALIKTIQHAPHAKMLGKGRKGENWKRLFAFGQIRSEFVTPSQIPLAFCHSIQIPLVSVTRHQRTPLFRHSTQTHSSFQKSSSTPQPGVIGPPLPFSTPLNSIQHERCYEVVRVAADCSPLLHLVRNRATPLSRRRCLPCVLVLQETWQRSI